MIRLHISDEDFETKFSRIVNNRRESDERVASDVSTILEQVRHGGDEILRDLTMRFDKHPLTADVSSWRIGADQCKAAFDFLEKDAKAALELAAERIRA